MNFEYLCHPKLPSIIDFLKSKISSKPQVSIVLGSGLGAFADEVKVEISIDYNDIPNFFRTGIPGHKGRLIFGDIAGKKVMCFAGRVHYYEGYSFSEVTLSVQVAHALGVKTQILSCSVGGLNPKHNAGDFLLINDHINFQGSNPIFEMAINSKENPFHGSPTPFVDICGTYRTDFAPALIETAKETGAFIHQGSLCAVLGPIYETPAEVKMFQTLGADAVCMSTVPEAIMAKYLGMDVVGIALITNAAHLQIDKGPTHHEVLEVSKRSEKAFVLLMKKTIELI